MKFILFASLLLLTQQQLCNKYSCLEDTTENKDKCSVTSNNEIKVKKCSSGQACNTIESESTLKCGAVLKKVDESCTLGPECYSGTCIDKKCVGKQVGESCSNHLACAKNLLCYGQCQEFKKADEECSVDAQCPFGYGCGIIKEGDTKTTCIKLYSVELGKYSTNPNLCASGYIYNLKCATTKADSEGVECTADTDCKLKITVGDATEVEGYGQCKCSMGDAKNYCEYSTSHSGYSAYFKKLTEFHTGTAPTEFVANKRESLTSDIKKLQFDGSVQYKGISDCVKEYLLNSSSFIQVSIVALISLLLF